MIFHEAKVYLFLCLLHNGRLSYSMRVILYHYVRKKQSFHCILLIAYCSSCPQCAISITRHNDFLDKDMDLASRGKSYAPREECGMDIASHRKSDDHRQKKVRLTLLRVKSHYVRKGGCEIVRNIVAKIRKHYFLNFFVNNFLMNNE